MHIGKEQLKELIEKKQIITDFESIEKQITANGFDFRACAIVEITNAGKLAKEKKDNKKPELGKAYILEEYTERLNNYDIKEKSNEKTVKLKGLKPYLIISCEKVNTPENMMIHITPRSSLFRITQSLLGCSFGEAGYKGYMTFMLLPVLDCEIELGARIAQISFTQITGKANYEEQNESNYQGGKLF
ncbi:hypothetical protein B6U93_02320 [Candidatus Woesearchaeota archaeon ex4484_78]|nr:MAG: hypothetical protein B6U93_02320 [Candidatus Woesearchaeota archaeon ex4484_78]